VTTRVKAAARRRAATKPRSSAWVQGVPRLFGHELASAAVQNSVRNDAVSLAVCRGFSDRWCRSGIRTRTSLRTVDFKAVRKGRRINDLLIVALSRLRGLRGVLYSPRIMETQVET
jgi:hypothetical protein